MSDLIEHIVLFSLPPGSGPTELERLADELDGLFAKSSYVDSATLRFDLGLRSGNAARAELLAEINFSGEYAFREYLSSDEHETFATNVLRRMNVTIMSIQCHMLDQEGNVASQ